MLHQITSYLQFLWRSTNEHGIHSPFVFNLVTRCFYDYDCKPEYSFLKAYRKSLLQNHNTISITDFGAGSKVFKSNRREIAKIAKTAGITTKRAALLLRIVQYFQPMKMLEIGTSVGLATAAMAKGNELGQVTTVEGCAATAKVASSQLEAFGIKNATVLVSEFETFFQHNKDVKYDFVYFDGNHQKIPTLLYFDLLLPSVSNDTVWLFDDIHWSAEMEEAWEAIKNNPKVTVTIDTFQWGLVFFRKEQEKQHFVIRC